MSGQTILFVGVGRLGRPIAERMIAHGLDLHVADVSAEASAVFAARGTPVVPLDPAAPLAYARVVLCLPEPAPATALLQGWSRQKLPDATIVADLTTMPPSVARSHAAMLAEAGADYLDAPVSRSANNDDMVVAASGARTAFDLMQPILSAIGGTVHYLGQSGSASLLKAINQYLYLSYNFVFAQGVRLGHELGLPDDIVWDALKKGAAGHPLIDERIEAARQNGFRDGFILKRCLKDLDCLELASGFDSAALDVYKLVHREIKAAVDGGLPDRDILVLSQTRR